MWTRACDRLAVIGTPPYANQATPNSTPTARTSSPATPLAEKPSWMPGGGFTCLARRFLPCQPRLPDMNEPGYVATGRWNRKVEPFPGSLSTSTRLPWASTIRLTAARPMPTPPNCRVVELSTW